MVETSLEKKCQRIELILSDVDGVMTDGGVILHDEGHQSVRFHIQDGFGIRLWQKSGGQFGIITGRQREAVRQRATDLGIAILHQGRIDKLPALQEIASELGIEQEAICYIGDDLPDLPAIRAAGLGVAVANGVQEVREGADYTTSLSGGHGAIREVVELILKNRGAWDEIVKFYDPE